MVMWRERWRLDRPLLLLLATIVSLPCNTTQNPKATNSNSNTAKYFSSRREARPLYLGGGFIFKRVARCRFSNGKFFKKVFCFKKTK